MLPAQFQRLEHDDLAREMRRRQHMREQAQLVQRSVVDPIGAVDADHARQDRIDAEQARCERRDLVGWRCNRLALFRGGRGRDELRDGVGGGDGVRDEEPVVNAAGVVQRHEILDRITYGGNRDLADESQLDWAQLFVWEHASGEK